MESGISGFASLDEAAAAIAAYTPQRTRKTNPAGLMKVLRERDGRWYWHWDPKVLNMGRTEVLPRNYQGLLDVALENILVPTMLVRGLESDVVTQEGIDDLLARKPDVKIVEIDGAAHMIAGDQNDAFSNAVVSFLREQIGPTIGL
jgi:pimeloyl-ACP methyl ester carboxylesterase